MTSVDLPTFRVVLIACHRSLDNRRNLFVLSPIIGIEKAISIHYTCEIFLNEHVYVHCGWTICSSQKERRQTRDCSQPWHRISRNVNRFVNVPDVSIKMMSENTLYRKYLILSSNRFRDIIFLSYINKNINEMR